MRKICLHNIDDRSAANLHGYEIGARTSSREELRSVLGMDNFAALIIDLDERDALNAVVEALEIRPHMAVIGITGTNDINHAIKAQRAGCRQLASKPLEPNDLNSALGSALNEESTTPKNSKTIAVIGSTGGAGATTISCYLSMSLAEIATSTALVDLDFEFGGVAKAWDLNPKYTFDDLTQFDPIERQSMEDVMIELPSGVSILPRPRKIQDASKVDENTVKSVFAVLGSMFPFVVLDLPRRLDAITGCAIEHCDKLLVVTQQTVNGIFNAGRLTDGLMEYGVEPDRIEYVVNRYNKRVHQVTIGEMTKRVRKEPIGLIPNHYKSIGQASDLGEPVTATNPVRKAIGDVAEALAGGKSKGAGSGWMASLGLRK